MEMKKITVSLATVGMLSGVTVFADDAAEIAKLKQEIAELQETTQTLVDETSDLKTGFNYTTIDTKQSHSGLGAAASKVYYSKSPLSIGGYGEIYYSTTSGNNPNSSKVDVARFVPYIGYKFTDNIILNAEIEFEHGGVNIENGKGAEVIVEFMYLDFLVNNNFNIRAGNMLVPMGLINERHEPNLFTTVQRPQTAKYLIPTTWNESGLMAYGNIMNGLEYKAALLTALNTKVSTDKWLRDSRGGAYENANPKFAGVARVDYTGINGVMVGGSVYYSPKATKANGGGSLTMFDIHADVKYKGARVYGVYTQTTRGEAVDRNTSSVKKGNSGYINASYDVLSLTNSSFSLPIFVQYENVKPQASRFDGTSGDATSITTIGANFFPHDQVVLKTDYAMAKTAGVKDNTFSVSMGFIF